MRIDKKKIKEISPEQAKKMLESLNMDAIESGKIKLSSASQKILFDAADTNKEEIDEFFESI